MIQDFFTVGSNVITLFLLMGVGALCAKCKLLGESAVKALADLVLYIATPCVIINSCIREFDPAMFYGFLAVVAVAAVNHALLILLARVVFRDSDENRRRVLRCATVFSNAGYMAIPLQQAVLGDVGVFYCAAYIIVFNVFLWTYGLAEMSGESRLTVGKILLNPGVIGVAVGMLLFVLPIPVPPFLADGIGHLAALNTPVPMLIVGYYLARTDLPAALRDGRGWLCIALRLLAMPLLALGGMLLCGIRGDLLTACMICIATPVATSCTMFATRFDRNPRLSVNLVSLSTLVSVITLPLLVALTRWSESLL